MGGGPADELRGRVLASLGRDVVLATYRQLATELGELAAAVDAYAVAPSDTTRGAARTAFAEVMAVLERAEMMQLGPWAAMDLAAGGADLRDEVYAWPAHNVCVIDQATVSPEHADPALLAEETVNARGLGAIEYLLFFEPPDNACSPLSPINADGVWASYSAEQIAARRARHAHTLALLAAQSARAVVARWDGGFLAELTDPARPGALYGSAAEGLNAISDAMFYLDVRTKDDKLAVPAGLSTDCTTDVCPAQVESRFAGRSKEHVAENLRGFQLLFLGGPPGTDAPGFDDVLRDAGAGDVADDMAANLEAAIAAVLAIPGTLEQAVVSDLALVRAAYDAVKAVTDDLKTRFVMAAMLELPGIGGGDVD
jgi:predicted lipoprotein